jgi:hypothetical protein
MDVNGAMGLEIDNWTYTGTGKFREKIDAFDTWAEKHTAQMTDVVELMTKLDYGLKTARLDRLTNMLDVHTPRL